MTHRIARRIMLAIGATSLASTVACGSTTTTDADAGATSDAGGDAVTLDAKPDTGELDGGDAGVDTNGPDVPCVRRPFLVGAEPRAGALALRDDWLDESTNGSLGEDPDALDGPTRLALAAAWLEDGRQEHASIAAFARFTMLALSVGAPPELVVGAQRAGLDEVRHARGCFSLARRYGGVAHGPGTLGLEGALEELSLAQLAALTVAEGCVGETLGVLLATEQRDGATDRTVRAFLARLVRDEQRHAELAWAFVRWALATGGNEVRAGVERAFDEAIAASLAIEGTDAANFSHEHWAAHGRITAAESRRLVRQGLRDIVEPCRRALMRPGPRPGDESGALAFPLCGDGPTL